LSQAQDSSLTHSTLQLRATMSAIRHPCLIMGQCPSNFEGRNKTMNNSSSSATSPDRDEYPKVTQADLDRARFRVGLQPAPRRQRVTLSLDANLIDYFKSKAGEQGYRTLINETLRRAKARGELEGALTSGHHS
ncbi:MAG: BrnA antitoxin of type II toxin-antitoxin system, partial [Candidatus Kentron sp. G]